MFQHGSTHILHTTVLDAGDQNLFVRRQDFEASGGFREDLAIMEDADFSIRLHTGDHLSSPTPPIPSSCPSHTLQSQGSNSSSHQHKALPSRQSKHCENAHSALPSLSHAVSTHALTHSPSGGRVDSSRSAGSSESSSHSRQKHPRRRIKHVVYRSNETSGRRMAQWGPLKSTFLHFKFGLMWYWGCSSAHLQRMYNELYTDTIR